MLGFGCLCECALCEVPTLAVAAQPGLIARHACVDGSTFPTPAPPLVPAFGPITKHGCASVDQVVSPIEPDLPLRRIRVRVCVEP